jgi:alanine transaminase
VYQDNIYGAGLKFHSFAEVMHGLAETEVTLFSFHSVSKGYLGECGHRGGYMEVRNMSDEVYAELVKLQSIGLCSNVDGQLVTYLMVDPPKPGDESWELYKKEKEGILGDLKEKAELLGRGLAEIPGMHIKVPQGAMYAFVRFDLPVPAGVNLDKMLPSEREAWEAKRDNDYCLALLEETGICVVPGSGFGQKPGTLHFRTTFLPPKEDMAALVEKMKLFHAAYTAKLAR